MKIKGISFLEIHLWCYILVLLPILFLPQISLATIFQPGETLEPDCAPGASNCGVATTTTTLTGSTLMVSATSTNSVLEILQGVGDQLADFFQVRDVNGLKLFSVSASGSLKLNSLNGPLQSNNGTVSATTSIGVMYGGTGFSALPSYGQLLVGNSLGGYTLTATSSLGLATTSDALT